MRSVILLLFFAVNLILLCNGSYSHEDERYILKALKLKNDTASKELAGRFISNKIKSKFENFKKVMKVGNAAYNVPVLDPFKLDTFNFTIDKVGSRLTGGLTDFYLKGMSNYNIRETDFSIWTFKLAIDFFWPKISGHTGYSVNGIVLDKWPVFGSGSLSFEVEEFRFASKIQVKLNVITRKVSMTGFENTNIEMKSLKLKVNGVLDSNIISDSISQSVTNVAPEFLRIYKKEITHESEQMMMIIGNKILGNYTLNDLYKIADGESKLFKNKFVLTQ